MHRKALRVSLINYTLKIHFILSWIKQSCQTLFRHSFNAICCDLKVIRLAYESSILPIYYFQIKQRNAEKNMHKQRVTGGFKV